jgi:glycosyltransferase involved in cell wall biosynthesis
MNKTTVLHITHSDLQFDSRILKELSSIKSNKKLLIKAIGISADNQPVNKLLDIDIINLILISKYFNFFSKKISSYLSLLEFYIRLFFKGILFRPKIIHCHDTIVLPIGFLLSIIFNSKLIYDAHELESKRNGQSKLSSKVTLLIEKFTIRYIDVLITVSPSILNWYQNSMGVKKSIVILNSPQLTNENFDTLPNNYLRKMFNIPDNCKVFIYLGLLVKGRGVDLYLNVFQSTEIKSHIVFIGHGDYVSKIQSSSYIYDNIHYHQPVKHDEVVNIAKSSDVGLVIIENTSLSYYFCLPNKLFEYAFSGLFILASDFPDMKKVIEEYDLGIVCSVNKESIKEAIIKLENSRIIKSNKDLNELSWNSQSKKLINLYNDLL